MSDSVEFLTRGVLIGVGGSALMDAWPLSSRRVFNVQGLDYALLGRWIGHFPRRRFFHERIASADPIRGERPLGWVAHYSIGIAASRTPNPRAARLRNVATHTGYGIGLVGSAVAISILWI